MRSLCRLLLQRSDRHPIARIDDEDLKGFDPGLVRRFLQQGLLIRQEWPADGDGMVFQQVEGGFAALSIDGEHETVSLAPDALRQFEIDFVGIGAQIRASSQLTGAPVEALGPRVIWLGAMGTGSRRREFYLVRALRARNALDVALAVKGRSAARGLVLITPTERDLPNSVLKQLGAEAIEMIAAADALDEHATEPFTLTLPTAFSSTTPEPGDEERLVIDAEGMRATFDGVGLDLRRREFAVLKLLAIELTGENGIVRRDLISATIREVTRNEDANEEQVDKAISLLRKALGAAARAT
ncbi:MAG TPA: hypothetical protein VMN39_02460, partial [Longimicrobiaceae bacterium]|nr:hypothetical protein [Longimicrobiaceae bacterium]